MGLSLDIKRFSNEIDGIFSTIKTMLINLVAEEYNFFNLEAEIQREKKTPINLHLKHSLLTKQPYSALPAPNV